jgi:lipopolysaccharide/colanic/teichoic acid biosynthesis glycosyltransferase
MPADPARKLRIETPVDVAPAAPAPVRRAGAADRLDAAAKRALDVAIASVGLVLGAPALLLVALVVRTRLGSPVLFVQPRAGLGGRPFRLFKFRTMLADHGGTWNPATDAHRLTPLGRTLRRWSLDELPQLWNVLRGDMSLVGPRPLPLTYLPRYSATQARRHAVRPGITGWAQVRGRNATTWGERFALDVWYVDNRSVLLDVRILLMTVGSVLSGHGVTQTGHATMQEFRGE